MACHTEQPTDFDGAHEVHACSVAVAAKQRCEPPSALTARIASARTAVAAVTPLIAEAVAARRELLGLAIDAAPTRPTVAEFNEAWDSTLGRQDVAALTAGLCAVADLLAEMNLIRSDATAVTSPSDRYVTLSGD